MSKFADSRPAARLRYLERRARVLALTAGKPESAWPVFLSQASQALSEQRIGEKM